MSRCFPFPPPGYETKPTIDDTAPAGYEKKPTIDDTDLLTKVYMLSLQLPFS